MTHVTSFQDFTGRRFGKLTVIERAPSRRNLTYWRCRCDCGNTVEVWRANLLRGTTSCGCAKLKADGISSPDAKPAEHRAYRSWRDARGKCENPNDKSYKHFGAQSIRMCEEWKNSFQQFFADMGPCPPNHFLGLIKYPLGFRPGNAKWMTQTQLSATRRKNER